MRQKLIDLFLYFAYDIIDDKYTSSFSDIKLSNEEILKLDFDPYYLKNNHD